MEKKLFHLRDKLLEALDKNYNVIDFKIVRDVLSILENTPANKETMTLTRLGKIVNLMRKDLKLKDQALAIRAKRLVRRWHNDLIGQCAREEEVSKSTMVHEKCINIYVSQERQSSMRQKKKGPKQDKKRSSQLVIETSDYSKKCYRISSIDGLKMKLSVAHPDEKNVKYDLWKKIKAKEELVSQLNENSATKNSSMMVQQLDKISSVQREKTSSCDCSQVGSVNREPPEKSSGVGASQLKYASQTISPGTSLYQIEAKVPPSDRDVQVQLTLPEVQTETKSGNEPNLGEFCGDTQGGNIFKPDFDKIGEDNIITNSGVVHNEYSSVSVTNASVTGLSVSDHKIEGVHGIVDDGARRSAHDDRFREWHDTASKKSYKGELLHILPYVIKD